MLVSNNILNQSANFLISLWLSAMTKTLWDGINNQWNWYFKVILKIHSACFSIVLLLPLLTCFFNEFVLFCFYSLCKLLWIVFEIKNKPLTYEQFDIHFHWILYLGYGVIYRTLTLRHRATRYGSPGRKVRRKILEINFYIYPYCVSKSYNSTVTVCVFLEK